LIVVSQPAWRIITDAEWQAVHGRLDVVRTLYLTHTAGHSFGRPPLGDPSKYLLTNLALCGCCGGPLRSKSRTEGRRFYVCAGYHERGRTICANNADVPMTTADHELIETLLEDVLEPSMIGDAVDEALRLLRGEDGLAHAEQIDRELATVRQERDRLVTAIAAGGQLEGL
jgi:hypothetical protein